MVRKLCKICQERPVAINYYKGDRIFYRSKCDHCAKNRAVGKPKWFIAGYRLKNKCDRCGFSSKHQEQFTIYYIDGNPSNCKITNLKTVCSNCLILLQKLGLPWRRGDLIPDL